MKKIAVFLCMMLLISSTASAFLYEVKVLTPDEIEQLQDGEILELYAEALIEKHASEVFHGRSGFNPKEYNKYKKLLGLIVDLRMEMQLRELVPPPIEDWLR